MKRHRILLPALLLMLALLSASCSGVSNAPTWQEQYDLGVRYLSEGNYEEAIIAFTAAIEIDPKQALAYVGRADAYVASGETEENLAAAQTDYEKAIELDETLAEAYCGLADVYIRWGDFDKALEILREELDKTENNHKIENKITDIEAQKHLVEKNDSTNALGVDVMWIEKEFMDTTVTGTLILDDFVYYLGTYKWFEGADEQTEHILSFTVTGPEPVRWIEIAIAGSWYNPIMTTKEDIENMVYECTEEWKKDNRFAPQIPPFSVEWHGFFGKQILLIGLDESKDPIAYAFVEAQVPQ